MALPLRIVFDQADAALIERIRRAWSRCTHADSAREPVATLRFPGPGTDSPAGLLSELSSQVTLEAIAQWSGQKLLFHAAGLSDPLSGLTSVLVASSGTGKTTASRALGQSLEYLSDETVCVDAADLSIEAYPKPLSVIVEPEKPKEQMSPDALGLRAQTRSARLNKVLLLQRDPEGPEGELSDPLPLTHALELLVPNISGLPAMSQPLSSLIRTIRAVGGVRAVYYTDIANVADLLVEATRTISLPQRDLTPLTTWRNPVPPQVTADPDHLRAALPEPELGSHLEATTDGNGAPETGASGVVTEHRSVCVTPWAEAVENPEDPGQLMILLAEQLVVIAGIAPTVWHACREHGERTPRQLEAAVVEACGENPRARDLVNLCVGELVRTGALQPVCWSRDVE